MDRGVWGEGGEGPPASCVRARVCGCVTCGCHNIARHDIVRGVGGFVGGEGDLTSVNAEVLPVCGPEPGPELRLVLGMHGSGQTGVLTRQG